MIGLLPFVGLIYGHQGGWDEVVLVGAPVVLLVFLLLLAKKRAQALVAARQSVEESNAEG